MNQFTTRNRKLEQFMYLHGVHFQSQTKDRDGLTVWAYVRTETFEKVLREFNQIWGWKYVCYER